MKFGLQHPVFTFDGIGGEVFETVSSRARSAEEGGFDSFWLMDHLMQIPGVGRPDEPLLESWTTISSLVGVTKKIRLGTLVTGNIYRNPALLAKMGATVDVLSNGRLYMGVGAGWFEKEADSYGIPHYDVPGRLDRLDEALQIIRGLWSNDRFSFDGRYYKIVDAVCEPKPLQKPRPPIMVGGDGERRTLRLVAKYGDACNISGGAATVRHKLKVLRSHCKAVGRDYDEIETTNLCEIVIAKDVDEARLVVEEEGYTPEMMNEHVLFGTPDKVRSGVREIAEAGIQHLIFSMPARREGAMMDLFSKEVIPHLS